jgi:hypothetical protein
METHPRCLCCSPPTVRGMLEAGESSARGSSPPHCSATRRRHKRLIQSGVTLFSMSCPHPCEARRSVAQPESPRIAVDIITKTMYNDFS